MALLKFISADTIVNPQVMALAGHLIKSNKQVHDFQYILINDFLQTKGIVDALKHVRNVIFESDVAVSFHTAAQLFQEETPSVRCEIYLLLAIISRVDGFFDKNEGIFFEQFAELCGDYREYDSKAQRHASRLRKLLKKENSKYRSGRRSNSNDNLFRISQNEYLSTINECRKIAKEDFSVIKPICEETIVATEALAYKIHSLVDDCNNSEAERNISEALSIFAQKINNVILPAARAHRLKLHQKEAAVEDFTIVLVGRTKAGKSTLKTVLTGSGKDEIGKGKQRTTLVNYIYEWNNLRIIDTPGIDAGGDIEQADKDIADAALTEADIVCYLTPCDGVPKKTIEFIEQIVKSNKPVLILLNYKLNIRDEDNLEDFLDDPEDWRSDKGKNSILGYYEPIRRAAIQNGYEEMVSCYPVFLLAALMSDEDKHAKYASTLRKSSGIDEFLAALKIIVVEQGTFLRSKTIIDDSIGHCATWLNDLKISLQNLTFQLETLKNARLETYKKIDRAQSKFINNTSKVIRQAFKILATQDAKRFAEMHFAQTKGLDEEWKKYYSKIGFERKLNDAIGIELSIFSKTICDIFEDLAVDLEETMACNRTNIKFPVMLDLFPAREVTRFIGDVLGLAGAIVLIFANTNPIGWVLTGASVVLNFASGLFKKKADREKAAQDKLYQKLKEEIEKQCEKTVGNFERTAQKETSKIVKQAKVTYAELEHCLEGIVDDSTEMCSLWEDHISELNAHFAKRVLQYLSAENTPRISLVARTFGESMDIYLLDDIPYNTSKLEGLLRDKVNVIGPNEFLTTVND